MQLHGYNLTKKEGYYTITLNTTTVVNGQTIPERYAVIDDIKGGMWKSCSVISGKIFSQWYYCFFMTQNCYDLATIEAHVCVELAGGRILNFEPTEPYHD